jgi:type IV secretory pathway TrbD component
MREPRRNRVYKSLHRPLTIMGIDRRMFILAGTAGMATMEVAHSILGALMIFAACAAFGYWVTEKDPAFLMILLKADKFKARYDAAKQQVPNVEIR